MKKNNEQKYIVRHVYNSTKGWVVKPPKRMEGEPASKLFSDNKYGGMKKAKEAAKKYLANSIKSGKSLDQFEKTVKTARNKSGIVGITKTKCGCWMGFGDSIKEGKWTKRYSINKHGEKEAFRLACKMRYKLHGPLIILKKIKDLDIPCKIPVPYEKIYK